MIEIGQLRLHLPPGFGPRAGRIARLVADRLATRPVAADGEHAHLSVHGVVVTPAQSDQRVAGRIAGAIRRAAGAQGGR
jgi:hypothetical protein